MTIDPGATPPAAQDAPDGVDLFAEASAAAAAARERTTAQRGAVLATLERRRSRTTLLQRAVDSLPYLGPFLVALATSIWLYDLLLLVRILVLDA